MGLTGRFDFQRTWTGKIVLRVEEEVPALFSRGSERPLKRRWRNATLMDLTCPEMRMLMDMRTRPQYPASHVEVARVAPSSTTANVVRLGDPDAPAVAPQTRPPVH